MPKDPTLSELFFSPSYYLNDDKRVDLQKTIDLLIKKRLYPYLDPDIEPSYGNNLALIKDQEKLQTELRIIIGKIKRWGEIHHLPDTATLIDFHEKLSIPNDSIVIMYGPGKKHLETVATFLEEPAIKLEQRKAIYINLLADKELTKCIAGCYSRISSAAEQLIESFEGPHQVRRWIQSYLNTEARKVATQRPFPMPASYQKLICKASDNCSEAQNMLHANNYLLTQAKEKGFPITLARDTGALALNVRMSPNDKHIIVNAYLKHLEKTISAESLINSLSEKFYEDIQSILGRDINFSDQIDLIKNKLNLLGDDDFSIHEILNENSQLKSVNDLKITITERLVNSGILKNSQMQIIQSSVDNKRLECHLFPGITLSWIRINEERKPLLLFIKEHGLAPFMHWKTDELDENGAWILRDFLIKNPENLLHVVNQFSKDRNKFFLEWPQVKSIAISIIKENASPNQFLSLLKMIPDENIEKNFFQSFNSAFIRNLLREGIYQAGIDTQFPGLSFRFQATDYDANAKKLSLNITQELLKRILKNKFINFENFIFYKVDYIDYLKDISFLHVNLRDAQFFQPIINCRFDFSDLRGTKFKNHLSMISFQNTDLRTVSFQLLNTKISEIDFYHTKLSTFIFAQLRDLAITNFSGADLSQVNFQDTLVKSNLRYLNFHEANLESVNLNELNLEGTWFTKSNLNKATLINSQFNLDNKFDHETKLENSEFTLSTIRYLHQKLGVHYFKGCRISVDWGIENAPDNIYFEEASFNGAKFTGKILRGTFINSDLTDTQFHGTPESSQNHYSTFHLRLNLKDSRFDGASFNYVSFIRGSKFSDSSSKDIVFNNVQMDPDLLFKFYEQGHRNFLGVTELRGNLVNKLFPLPTLDAILNKKIFLHLYQQGLRDFRGSNLNSFYLGELLEEKNIAEIDLKLDGAHYKPFSLPCLSRSQRSTQDMSTTVSPGCTAHILFQSQSKKNLPLTSIEKINQHFTLPKKPHLVKTLTLRTKPIFTLEYVNELIIHWDYQPQDIDFSKLLKFINNALPSTTRSTLKLQSYIYQPEVNPHALKEFVQSFEYLGIKQVSIEYLDGHKRLSIMQLEGSVLVTSTVEKNVPTTLYAKIHAQYRTVTSIGTIPKSLPTPNLAPKEKNSRERLQRMMLRVKTNLKSVLRTAGRQGALYTIAAAIMQILHQWYINRAPEAKVIDAKTKADLKILARDIAREIGQQRSANERQIELAERVTCQCIDRGECSSEEKVINDVVDSLYQMRPDLVVGNEVLFNKIKDFLITIGSFLSNQFDKIGQFFDKNEYKKQKRAIINWDESPFLMEFIKAIESGFDVLGLDLQQEDVFSSEDLVSFLVSLWQALEQQGITKNSTTEFILERLENKTFIEQYLQLPSQKSLFTELQSLSSRPKRAVYSSESNSSNLNEKILEKSEAYLAKYDRQTLKNDVKTSRIKPKNKSTISNPSKPKNNKKDNHSKFYPSVRKKDRSQKNKVALSFLQKETKKPKTFTPCNHLSNKQKRDIPTNRFFKPSPSINKMVLLSYKKETILSQPSITATTKLIGRKNAYSYNKTTSTNISLVTTKSDVIGTLFLLDTAVRYRTRNPHRPTNQTFQSFDKEAERQIQRLMERKLFNRPHP